MPESIGHPIGTILTDTGIADVSADSKSTDGATEGTYSPEIIAGFETESPEPRTERINLDGDSIKRTKSGKIDGRTLRGKRNSGESSRETGEKTNIRLDSFSIEGLLIGIHSMGATILKTPELEISKEEGKQLSDAIQAVAKEYNHVINPKTAAWIQLCIACGAIYGTRIVAIRTREKHEKKLHVIKTNAAPPVVIVPPEPSERDGAIN